jgi:hypothetical protein
MTEEGIGGQTVTVVDLEQPLRNGWHLAPLAEVSIESEVSGVECVTKGIGVIKVGGDLGSFAAQRGPARVLRVAEGIGQAGEQAAARGVTSGVTVQC